MPVNGDRGGELARAVARLHCEACGRGPGSPHAFVLTGLAVVVAAGMLTPPETRLARSADTSDVEAVRDLRRRTARALTPELLAVAEAALGLRVRAVLTDVDPA